MKEAHSFLTLTKLVSFITPNTFSECISEFSKAKIRIETDKEQNMTRLSIKPEGAQEWTVCMQLNFAVQYKTHLYISALTSN